MEKLFYLILLALFTTGLFAQRSLKHCAFEPTAQQIERMNGYREAISRFGNDTRVELRAPIRIPVRAVLFSSTRISSGPTQLDFERALQGLNRTFAAANLEFFACDTLRRVISSRYADFDSDFEENSVWRSYGQAGVINIFCFEEIDFGSASGYTYLPDHNGPEAIFLINEALLNSTLPHEMGHYFGLYHTHGKSNCGTTDELVNDPNCQRSGDDVCDTPADPNLLGLFCSEDLVDSASCTYIGTETDRLGNLFEPDPSNIMAYTWDHCTTRFTPGQYERMRFFAENVRLYADDCSGRIVCPIPQVSLKDKSLQHIHFQWSTKGEYFQVRYRLNQDSNWVKLKDIYLSEWIAFDLKPCTRVEMQVRAGCDEAFTDWSEPLVVFTAGCEVDGYCASYGGEESIWIQNVLADNLMIYTGDDQGYGDFRNFYWEGTAGQSYDMRFFPGGFIRNKDTLYWRLWMDLNRDQDFNDTGELMLQAKSLGRGAFAKGTLKIPTVLKGTYRLRLSLSNGNFVDACGNGGQVLETEEYEYLVKSPSGVIPDEAGQNRAEATLLNPDLEQGPDLKVYPNPGTGWFNLLLPESFQGEAQVEFYNSTGQRIQNDKIFILSGTPAQVKLQHSLAGVYWLRLRLGETFFSKRIILINP